MITITKSNPPMYLTPIDIRQRNHPAQNAFNNDADFSSIKQKLKQELLDEQGHICCFCMGRIDKEEMKVAHRLSQDAHPESVFNYTNLFAACKGNEGADLEEQHCDSYQGSRDLEIDLTRADLTQIIFYNLNEGKIGCSIPAYDEELNSKLNLNLQMLKERRISVFRGTQQALATKHNGRWPVDILRRKVEKLKARPYEPYFQVQVYYLEQEIEKRSRP